MFMLSEVHHQLEGCGSGLHNAIVISHGEFNPTWSDWPRAVIAEFKMKNALTVRWFLGCIY